MVIERQERQIQLNDRELTTMRQSKDKQGAALEDAHEGYSNKFAEVETLKRQIQFQKGLVEDEKTALSQKVKDARLECEREEMRHEDSKGHIFR